MTLSPCPQCRRHVAITESTCPFCAAPLAASAAPETIYGRWSRAAVFAGLAGCYTSNPPPQNPPPPPPDQQQTFAQPPASSGVITGVVTDGSAPRPGVAIRVEGGGLQQPIETRTDGNGRYQVGNLAPGTYRVTFGQANHPRQRPPQRTVQVADGSVQVDVTIAPQPVYDPSNVPKPYGAPPARRRIV